MRSQKSRSLFGFHWFHVALFRVDWGSVNEGRWVHFAARVSAVSALHCRLLRVWCLRSASGVSAPRPASSGVLAQHRVYPWRVWRVRVASGVFPALSDARNVFVAGGGRPRSATTRIAGRLQQITTAGTLPPQQDGTIGKKLAVQGPRSPRQASSETADAHDSRFTSGRSGALQPSPAELCCEKMPRRDSIGAASCCRDSRGGFNYFARLSDAFEP